MSENLNNDQIISADFEVSTELNIQLGSVYQGSGADSLSELSDVAIDTSTLANGNSLLYNSTSGKWENGEVAPGVDDLSELGDVSITTPSNDQILRYNSTSGKWVNSAESAGPSNLNGLNDVSITSPSADQILKYNSTSGKWENGTGGGGASALSDLSDVDVGSASDKDYLTYNYSTHKWENKGINSILSSTTRGAYCNFYTPLSAGLLNCRVYAGLRVEPGTPTPNSARFPIRYSTLAVGSCKNGSFYSYYLSGLFKTLEFEGCTWYLDLGSLTWYYEDGVFKAQGYFFNAPKKNFSCICSSNEYTYNGPSTSTDKTIGYWSPSSNTYAFWIRDDQFNGDVSAFTSHVSGIYTLYESRENNNSININNYNMLLSEFDLEGWAIKLSYSDYGEYTYGGEWDVVNKTFYYTWADKDNSDMSSGYTINNQYVIYDTSEWTYGLKTNGDSYCTHFTFESDTENPSVDCYSIHNNKIIFNISSLQSSWSDWLANEGYFKFHYETSNITSSSLSYSDIPSTYKTMNYMWSNTNGSVEAQYYDGNTTPYIDLIKSTNLTDLNDVDIDPSQLQSGDTVIWDWLDEKWKKGFPTHTLDKHANVGINQSTLTNGQVLTYDSTSGKWVNGASSGGASDLDDLTDVSISSPSDGQVLTYDSNSSTWINSSASGDSGHTIVDSEGTSLTQRTNLQFLGAYSEDNSTDDTTEVNIVRSMTKAEFDLLSDDEKVGIINVTDITDDSENEFQPIVYSFEEREIGVWTDGRPLYQKTISMGTLPNKTTKAVEHGISNIDVTAIVSLMAMASNGTYAIFPRIHDSQVNAQIFFEVNSTYITCYGRGQDQSGWTTCYVTIQYCKTTDQPGSGQWTPQGVPTVHYSTNEQVVGTWIDGSTICERTYTYPTPISLPNTDWYTTDIPNSDKSIILSAISISAAGMYFPLGCTRDSGTTLKVFNLRTSTVACSALVIRYVKSSS